MENHQTLTQNLVFLEPNSNKLLFKSTEIQVKRVAPLVYTTPIAKGIQSSEPSVRG